MTRQVPFGENKQFGEGWREEKWPTQKEPETVINTSSSDFSVSFTDPDGVQHENVYPDSTTSDIVALNTAADLNIPVTPEYQERMVEHLDEFMTKPYVKELKFELKGPDLKWPPSFGSASFTLTRGLKKVKKYFREKEDKGNK